MQYQLAGHDGWAPLSVNPHAGFMYWLKSVAYAASFMLVLLLVNSKQRLVLLAYALLLSGVFQAFYGSMMTLSNVEFGFFSSVSVSPRQPLICAHPVMPGLTLWRSI